MTTINTFRQVLIVVGLTINCMSDGFIFGQMSGMIDALSATNSNIPLTEEDISWIASTVNITCFFGCFVVCIISRSLGRRISLIILNIPVLICWIALYFAKEKSVLLYTRGIVGMSFGGILLLTFVSIGEYVSPKLRHFYLILMSSVGFQSGVTIGHVFSLLIEWRKVVLLGMIFTGLSCLFPLFWVESPFWLATQGKFEECERAFRALNKPGEETEIQLQSLISFEKRKRYSNSTHKDYLTKVLRAFSELYFWRVQLMALVVSIFKTAAGRTFINTLAITILKEITGQNKILLYTLLVDLFGILGVLIGCYLFKKYKIRLILFGSGIVSIIILLLFSGTLYYIPNENNWLQWIKIILLACYCVILSAGLCPVFDVICTDIQPLEIKEVSYFVMGFFAGIVQFLGIKLSNNIINAFDYSGLFLMNTVISILCLSYLRFFLPETSGKTLQEIDGFFKTGTFESQVGCVTSECDNVYQKVDIKQSNTLLT